MCEIKSKRLIGKMKKQKLECGFKTWSQEDLASCVTMTTLSMCISVSSSKYKSLASTL